MKYRGTTEEQRVENTRERTEGMEAGGREDRPARWGEVEIPPAGVIYTAAVLSVAWRDNDVAHEGTRSLLRDSVHRSAGGAVDSTDLTESGWTVTDQGRGYDFRLSGGNWRVVIQA